MTQRGASRIRIRRSLWLRIAIAVAALAGTYFIGLFSDSAHGYPSNPGLQLTAAAIVALYVFISSSATVVTVWSDLVQVDDWGSSSLVDRGQQRVPSYETDNGVLLFGGGRHRLEIARGLSSDQVGQIRDVFEQSQEARPGRLRVRRFGELWLGRMTNLVILIPALIVLLLLKASDVLAIPILIGFAIAAIALTELLGRRYPRFIDLQECSG